MKQFLLNIYNKLESSKYKVLILTLLFLFFVLSRNFLEVFNSTWYNPNFFTLEKILERSFFLISHWVIWYIMFFLIIFSVLRYFLKIEISKVLYFSLSSIVLVLPVFVSIYLGQDLYLQYLNIHDLKSVFLSLFSLFLFDKTNFVVFSEMIFLFLGFPIINYLITKKILKSILAPFFVFFLEAVFCAFMYICPSARCLITNVTNFGPAFFPFYWIPLSFLSLFVFLYPDIKKFLKENIFFTKKRVLFSFIFYIPLFLFFLFFTNFYFFDVFFISVSYFICYFVFLFLFLNYKKKKYFQSISFIFIYFLIISTPILFLIIRTFYFVYKTGVVNNNLLS